MATRKTKPRKPVRKPAARKAKPKRSAAPPARKAGIIPYLSLANADKAIEWYQMAFKAKVTELHRTPQGQVMHVTLNIGGAEVFASDILPMSSMQDPAKVGPSVSINVHHPKVDALWKGAVDAGANVVMPLDDQFWGVRYGVLTDPFGHAWALSWKSKLSKAELDRKAAEAMKAFGG